MTDTLFDARTASAADFAAARAAVIKAARHGPAPASTPAPATQPAGDTASRAVAPLPAEPKPFDARTASAVDYARRRADLVGRR